MPLEAAGDSERGSRGGAGNSNCLGVEMSMAIQRPSVAATTEKRAASVLVAAKAAHGHTEEAIGPLLRPQGGTGFELSRAGFELSRAGFELSREPDRYLTGTTRLWNPGPTGFRSPTGEPAP